MTHGQRRDERNKHRGMPSRRLICNMKTRDVGGPENIALLYHQAPTLRAQEGYPNVSGIGGRLVSIIKENVAAFSSIFTIPLGDEIINNQKLSSHPHDAVHVSRYDHGIASTRVSPAMADIDRVTLRCRAHSGRCGIPAATVQVPHLVVVHHIASCATVTCASGTIGKDCCDQ